MEKDNAKSVCFWDGCGFFFHSICWICSCSNLASISSLLVSTLPPTARILCCHFTSQHPNICTHLIFFSSFSCSKPPHFWYAAFRLDSDHRGGQMFPSDGGYCLFGSKQVRWGWRECLRSNTSVYCSLSNAGYRCWRGEQKPRIKVKRMMQTKCRVQGYLNKARSFTSSVFFVFLNDLPRPCALHPNSKHIPFCVITLRGPAEEHHRAFLLCGSGVILHKSFVTWTLFSMAFLFHTDKREWLNELTASAAVGGQHG